MSLVVHNLGQYSLLLESEGTRLLINPIYSGPGGAAAAQDADFVLQTRSAVDDGEGSLQGARSSEATIICHARLASWYGRQGVQNVHGMSLGSAYNFPFGKVIMTLAHQSGALDSEEAGAPVSAPVSFLVHFNDGLDLYIAGNSVRTADMELIGKAGGVDLAILPLGDQAYNGSDDALRAAQLVQAKHVLPVQESGSQEAAVLAERLWRVAEIDATVLAPGESATF
jgi:L-ascorbate metabolism protein UlaG (beta-lactamase superfamily)